MKLKKILGNDLVFKKEMFYHIILKLWLFDQTACLGNEFYHLHCFILHVNPNSTSTDLSPAKKGQS